MHRFAQLRQEAHVLMAGLATWAVLVMEVIRPVIRVLQDIQEAVQHALHRQIGHQGCAVYLLINRLQPPLQKQIVLQADKSVIQVI